jgi:long-subunit acyl-CoA synthetase (AMP-forming)
LSIQNAPRTFNEQFENIVRRFPDRIAFRLKTPKGYTTVSYGEAYHQARSVAQGLLALELPHRSRVAILSENRPEWVVAYLGIYLSGMVAVPLDTQISPAEWRLLLDDAEAHTVFAGPAVQFHSIQSRRIMMRGRSLPDSSTGLPGFPIRRRSLRLSLPISSPSSTRQGQQARPKG